MKQRGLYSFRSVKLHDFAGLFTRLCWCFHTLLSKSCFYGWTPSLDWGISSLLIILGKYAGKLLQLSSLTINSFTTVTIGFKLQHIFRFSNRNAINERYYYARGKILLRERKLDIISWHTEINLNGVLAEVKETRTFKIISTRFQQ